MPADEARSRNAVMGSALHGLATAHRRGRSNAQDCAISDRYWAWRPWRLRQSARRRSPSQPGTSLTSGSLCSAGSNAMSSQAGSTCRSVGRASGRKSPVPAACSMSKSIPPEVIWSATVANDSPGVSMTVDSRARTHHHQQIGDFVILNWRAVCGQCCACKRGRRGIASTPTPPHSP